MTVVIDSALIFTRYGFTMKFKGWLIALIAVFACVGVRAQEPIVIKFSHVVSRDAPKGKAAERFKELAEKATNGRVRVDVYPNSQLYKDREELEALQLGAVQMLAPSMAKFSPLGIREFEVFDLPYLFPNKEALNRVKEGRIGQMLLSRLEPKGITGLGYWDNGFKVMSANRPLRLPEDFIGQKMRIQSSRTLDAQMRALGASPVALGFGEVYQALQSGVVDGTENPPSNFYTQSMQNLQPHLTVSDHGYLIYAVIVNKKFWDGLPSGIRTALEGAMTEATQYANAIAQKENDDALEAIRKSGKTVVHVLTEQEKASWRAALAPVHKQMEARIGKDLITSVKREVGTQP